MLVNEKKKKRKENNIEVVLNEKVHKFNVQFEFRFVKIIRIKKSTQKEKVKKK